MRVVLDTNIFVSGIHWVGDSNKILLMWKEKRFELVSSIQTIEEITETLRSFRITLSEEDILMWENMILENAVFVEPEEKISIVKDDPDDNKFIETAIAGRASYIITQDNHLLKIGEFKGIRILTPKDFLEKVK